MDVSESILLVGLVLSFAMSLGFSLYSVHLRYNGQIGDQDFSLICALTFVYFAVFWGVGLILFALIKFLLLN